MRIPATLAALVLVGLLAPGTSGCAVNETYDLGHRSAPTYTIAILASPAIYIFRGDGGYHDGLEGPGAADPRAQTELLANKEAHEANVDEIRFQSTKVDDVLTRTVVKPEEEMGVPVGPQPPEDDGAKPAGPAPVAPVAPEAPEKAPAGTPPEEPAGKEAPID